MDDPNSGGILNWPRGQLAPIGLGSLALPLLANVVERHRLHFLLAPGGTL